MIDRTILFGIGLVLLATSYDLTRTYLTSTTSTENESMNSNSQSHSDDIYEQQTSTIPPPKIKNQALPTIKFLYCTS